MMGKRSLAVVALASTALLLAACGSSNPSTGSTQAAGKDIGVILPDAASSPRWETNDRPSLQQAFLAAGKTYDIQNATKEVSRFSAICDSMINEGVKVLMIVNLDSSSGAACEKKATAAGIKSIDYDRLTLGGDA